MKVEVGQRYGKVVTTEKFSDYLKSGKKVSKFKCVCDCGATFDASYSNLQSGNTTACYDCGRCSVGEKLSKDYAGKKYGQLTLVRRSSIKAQRDWKWYAVCDCGTTKIVRPVDLMNGRIVSCGHIQKIKAAKTLSEFMTNDSKQYWQTHHGVTNSMQVPGIALKCATNQTTNSYVPNWETGEMISCSSSYERKIVAYFNKNKISFDAQLTFQLASGSTYRVDFLDKNRGVYIEAKGREYEKGMKKYEEFSKHYPTELWDANKIAEISKDYRRDLSFVQYWDWSDFEKIDSEKLRTYPGIFVYPHQHNGGLVDFIASKTSNVKAAARKTKVVELTADFAREFLKTRHIQGGTSRTQHCYGLEQEGSVLAIATFSKHHRNNKDWVLERFACETGMTVVGGLSKLTKYAFERLGRLTSWADRNISNGDGYLASGWKLDGIDKGDYFYYDPAQDKVISKQARKKDVAQTPDGMTEAEHAILDGLWKIPTLGRLRFVFEG